MIRANLKGEPVFTNIYGVKDSWDWTRMVTFEQKYRRGDYTKVANNTYYSVSHVWRVLNNERGPNQDIIREAYNVTRRRRG